MVIDSLLNITVYPATPYVKTSSIGQAINFDFALENISGETLHLRKIQLSVLDTSGKLILQKFLDENGTAPGIDTLPKRSIEPGATQTSRSLHLRSPRAGRFERSAARTPLRRHQRLARNRR